MYALPSAHATSIPACRVRAFRPCAAGQQLFLSYGPYPNDKLLLFYGFALPGNPFDEAKVAFEVGVRAQRLSGLRVGGITRR